MQPQDSQVPNNTGQPTPPHEPILGGSVDEETTANATTSSDAPVSSPVDSGVTDATEPSSVGQTSASGTDDEPVDIYENLSSPSTSAGATEATGNPAVTDQSLAVAPSNESAGSASSLQIPDVGGAEGLGASNAVAGTSDGLGSSTAVASESDVSEAIASATGTGDSTNSSSQSEIPTPEAETDEPDVPEGPLPPLSTGGPVVG